MLKLVRELAVENPLALKIIMGIIAVTFVITMGWWGIQAPTENVAISINGHDIRTDEYRKAYNRAIDYYRNTYKEKFDAEMIEELNLREKVMEELVSRELWISAARELELKVSDEELTANIMKIKAFHKDGKFDSDLYERLVESNRMSISGFEDSQREELLIEKMKRLIRDSVSVTDEEVNETFPLSVAPDAKDAKDAKNKTAVKERPPEEMQRLKKFILFQKQEKAVTSYTASLREKAKVKVNKDLL